MDMAKSADKLASRGRYGDTTLVHMSPTEVAIMDRMTPGGLSTNPDTGQPEAFAFLLPLLASVAGPSIMSSLGLTGLGSILGTAALSGGASLLAGGDTEDALLSAVTGGLGAGLGSLGQGAKGAADAAKAAATVGKGAADVAQAADMATKGATLAAKAAQATQPAQTGLGGLLSKGVQAVKDKPFSLGVPLGLGAVGLVGGALSPQQGAYSPPKDDRYEGDYRRERFPGPRTVNQYQGDPRRYGQEGGEFNFFTPNNDRRASPQVLGDEGLERLQRLASGQGYMSGGKVTGPGDGRDDKIPAVLSDGEYIVPADVVSMLGRGSSNGGADRLDRMVEQIRRNPPAKQEGKPPRRAAA